MESTIVVDPRQPGQVVRNLRQFYGLSMVELAQEAGISRTYLWQIETADHTPSFEVAARIATVLRRSPGQIWPQYRLPDLSTTLRRLLSKDPRRASYSPHDLSEWSGIPRQTIQDWLLGTVSRPRSWQQLVMLAKVLDFSEDEVNEVLESANMTSVAELWDNADVLDRELLLPWISHHEPQLKAFISYKWESEGHVAWVKRLAEDLRKSGIDAKLDQWEVKYGGSFTDYMQHHIADADVFLFVITPGSVAAAEAPEGKGGAIKFEVQMMNARRMAEGTPIIGIYRSGNRPPNYLRDHRFADFRDDNHYASSLKSLVDDLLGHSGPPPVANRLRGS